jgi:hypothetical protein
MACAAICVLAVFVTATPRVSAQVAHARAFGPPAASTDELVEKYPFTYPLADGEPIAFADAAAVPSPASHLGRALGSRFTRHAELVGYFQALAAASDRVTVERYGTSHQGRPLIAVTITSPRNHDDLDNILARNRELTDPRRTSPDRALDIATSNPAIAWLSYNVHGNEGSCSEAAMQVAYMLAAGTNDEVQRWLDDTVVVIDPCLNPDGRERYVSFFENAVGVEPDPNVFTTEHREPWPSGRSNHYLFDLNRDWVWLSQPESRSRLALYRRYMPQLHVDYHEQGYHSPHFFGPGDTPYSANIPQPSKDILQTYGDHNALIFDTLGLPFATRERFDYLYPGYGKVTPVYHGAVGMLTEQAGHGRGGLAVNVDPHSGPDAAGGYTLTLRERIRNHMLTSLSNVETTAATREAQLERFYDFFATAMRPRKPIDIELSRPEPTDDAEHATRVFSTPMPTGYAFLPSNDPAKLNRLHDLLTAHGVDIRILTDDVATNHALPYFDDAPMSDGEAMAPVTMPAGSWYVPASQPMGYLARTLLDRAAYIEDVATYDITAWSAPLMFGLRGYELFNQDTALPTRAFDRSTDMPGMPDDAYVAPERSETRAAREGGVAWIIPADNARFPVALDLAARSNVFARLAGDPIEHGGRVFPAGSLIVHTSRNADDTTLGFLQATADAGLPAFAIDRGDPGVALGNNAHRRFIHPRVMLLFGSPLSSLSTGHTWHMLDHQFRTRHHRIFVDDFPPRDLAMYNVIVMPSSWGRLGDAMPERARERLDRWVRDGGTLIAVGSSAHWASRSLLGLDDASEDLGGRPGEAYVASDDEADAEPDDVDRSQLTYERRETRSHYDRIPGAVMLADVDTTHPLAFGADERLAFHVFSDDPLHVHQDGFVIARFGTLADSPAGSPSTSFESGDMETFAADTIGRLDRAHTAARDGDTERLTRLDRPPFVGWMSIDNARELAGTPAVTLHRQGRGAVVCFASDPTNRAMNAAGMRLLMNAITKGPSLSPALQPLGGGEARTREH